MTMLSGFFRDAVSGKIDPVMFASKSELRVFLCTRLPGEEHSGRFVLRSDFVRITVSVAVG
jgi:hypothetical protein